MKTVCSHNACNGCMACCNICSKGAITVHDSIKAVNAEIDEEKCINCNLCRKVCPQLNDVPMVKPIKWFQGWTTDEKLRAKSSSGGLASAIALQFVEDGGCCISCTFSEGTFQFSKAETKEEALGFLGSKYVKSNPYAAYRLIKEELAKQRKVLFIGLPCQVAGIRRYIGDTKNLYTIDLICHGSPSVKLLDLFLKENKIDISDINEISFREKTSYKTSVNGKEISKNGNRDLYMRFFLKKLIYTDNCYSCRYSTLDRCSDLTLGDSWGSELVSDEIKKGISLILCQTEKGESLLNHKCIHFEGVDLEKAVSANTNLSHPSVAPKERDGFFCVLQRKKSFKKAIQKTYPMEFYKYYVKEMTGLKSKRNK